MNILMEIRENRKHFHMIVRCRSCPVLDFDQASPAIPGARRSKVGSERPDQYLRKSHTHKINHDGYKTDSDFCFATCPYGQRCPSANFTMGVCVQRSCDLYELGPPSSFATGYMCSDDPSAIAIPAKPLVPSENAAGTSGLAPRGTLPSTLPKALEGSPQGVRMVNTCLAYPFTAPTELTQC